VFCALFVCEEGGNAHDELSSVERYDSDTQIWEVLEEASMNSKRNWCASAVLGG
jgi:hypothetical protein